MTPATTPDHRARAASMIVFLAGIWFFVSPWIYGIYTMPNAWNAWLVGAVMVIFAAIRTSEQTGTAVLSWLNALLGIWAFASPWIYGYTGDMGRFVNSLCVGVVVFVAALASANAMPHGRQPTHQAM